MERSPTAPSFVGIDVSKDRLDVHILPAGRTFTTRRDGNGVEQLVGELRQLAPVLIVLEATGGFEATVAAALAGARLPIAVVNPRQIRVSPDNQPENPHFVSSRRNSVLPRTIKTRQRRPS